MTDAKALLDTNVLLRLTISTAPLHETVRAFISDLRKQDVELWISRQIIREFLVQASHPRSFERPLTIDSAMREVEQFGQYFSIADETAAVTAQLLALLKEFPTGGKQIHDANIVATMLTNGIGTLLTLNVEDMKRFSPKIQIITPN